MNIQRSLFNAIFLTSILFSVFEILLRVSEGMTFKEAFEKVLPQRINIVPTSE